MASLFIKDPEAAVLAERLANIEGKTKTRAVIELLREAVARYEKPAPGQTFVDWVEYLRRTHPLPPSTGLKADKAFYDSLNDEDED